MSNYPASLDGLSTLFSPVDALSTKSLETTATVAIGAGDSTVSVASTAGGFAGTLAGGQTGLRIVKPH